MGDHDALLDPWKSRRDWVGGPDIIARLDEFPTLVSADDLLQMFPMMPYEQLDYLFAASQKHREQEAMQQMEVSETMKMTMSAKLSVDRVDDGVRGLESKRDAQLAESFLPKLDPRIQKSLTGLRADPQGLEWLQELAERMNVQNHWILSIQWQLQQLSDLKKKVKSELGGDAGGEDRSRLGLKRRNLESQARQPVL